MVIDSRQFENESIFLNDTTGDDHNQDGQHQGSENQNEETANVAFGSSKYKTLLAFVSGAMVGSTISNEDQSVSLSREDVQLDSGHCENIGMDANDWIELGFSPNFNRGNIPSMKSVAKKFPFTGVLHWIESSILLMRSFAVHFF